MTDDSDLIFREVDEDVRRDRLVAIWKRYGVHVIAGLVLVIVAVLGWQWFEGRRDAALKAQSERYQALLTAIEGKDPADTLAVLSGPESRGLEGIYATLAGFLRAGALARSGDHAAAAGLYDSLAADASDAHLAQYAAFLGAAERFAAGDSDGALLALDRLSASDISLRPSAMELSAAIHLSLGDAGTARPLLEKLAGDAATPPAMRARVGDLLALLAKDEPAADVAAGPTGEPAAVPPSEGADDEGGDGK